MKKVFRFFAIAASACGMTMAVSCNKDDNGENGGNGGNGGGGNTENLPTTIDENFDNGMPSGWTSIDADGDGYEWVSFDESFFGDQGTEFFGNGTNCMLSASYINGVGALSTDNYLVMPKVYIEDGATLSYQIASYQLQYADSYQVVIGTLANGTFTVSETLLTEETTGGISDGNGFVLRSIDLSAYKGQSLYIAFRHNCEDCYWLVLDDVKITK